MKIIGFNLGKTTYGLPLDNGGACLCIDGQIVMMINEERLNRRQYSSGFAQSIQYLLINNDLSVEDIDLFVASSCLEPRASVDEVYKQLNENGFNIPQSKIKVCDHHLSHAHTAYYPSGFDSSIIMVLDGDGNTLSEKMVDGTENTEKYWCNRNEHNSYYVGNGDKIELLERDEVAIGENGFGGAYRYFTYFCGFYGYRYAGKLMGLSAYGSKRNTYKNIEIFELGPNGKVKCLVPDADRLSSPKVVEDWLMSKGVHVKARKPHEPITEGIEDVAFLIQRELDKALVHKVKYLIEKTGIKNLCIAGGVGLNAVSNRAILDNSGIEHIFIQPAAGDSGQCLGNAYFGISEFDASNLKRQPISIYQGKNYSDEGIEKALKVQSAKVTFEKKDFLEIARIASAKLSDNKIIGWFQGRSEIGPRALGNRSILANPINKDMKDILNDRVKHRELFRPFAPSVLEEKANEWFAISVPAPYMIINAPVKQPLKIPAITHEDGSARLQTINSEQNFRYYTLISEFEKITDVPVVLDTSFNDNEAIVESPEDAIKTFLRTDIDYLFIGDYFVQKKSENEWVNIATAASKIQGTKNEVLNPVMMSMVKKYANGNTLFDYGCGWGEFADVMQKEGFTVSAFDDADEMVFQAKGTFPTPTFFYKKDFNEKSPEMKETFSVVTSNLVLCILEKRQQDIMLENIKTLVKKDGLIVISFCHPKYDYLQDSLVSTRLSPKDAKYSEEFMYEKEIKENGIRFHDWHRPLEYYMDLFNTHGLKVLEIKESDVLGTSYQPDFIIFAFQKVNE